MFSGFYLNIEKVAVPANEMSVANNIYNFEGRMRKHILFIISVVIMYSTLFFVLCFMYFCFVCYV